MFNLTHSFKRSANVYIRIYVYPHSNYYIYIVNIENLPETYASCASDMCSLASNFDLLAY